jgi:hypothetical protein
MTGLVPCNRSFLYREKGGGVEPTAAGSSAHSGGIGCQPSPFLGLRLIIGKMKKKTKKMRARSLFFSSSSFHVVGQVSIGKMSIFSLLLLLFSMDGGEKNENPREICR